VLFFCLVCTTKTIKLYDRVGIQTGIGQGEKQMECIQVTKDNIEKKHICRAISNNKDIQVSSRKEWMMKCFDDGLCILSSAKKPFLSDPEYLLYKGFGVADTSDAGIDLMYLPFDEKAAIPRFTEAARPLHFLCNVLKWRVLNK